MVRILVSADSFWSPERLLAPQDTKKHHPVRLAAKASQFCPDDGDPLAPYK